MGQKRCGGEPVRSTRQAREAVSHDAAQLLAGQVVLAGKSSAERRAGGETRDVLVVRAAEQQRQHLGGLTEVHRT